jgi:hypothetical protein
MRHRREKRRVKNCPAKYRFTCPLCDGVQKLDATYKCDSFGRWRWFIGCFSITCSDGSEYLAALADIVDAEPWQLLEDPLPWLKGLDSGGPSPLDPAPLPTHARIEGLTRALTADKRALNYVTRQRGLTRQTIYQHRLGFDGQAIVIPVIDRRNRVVNVRRRFFSPQADGPKITGLRGCAAQLYPPVESSRALLLCEGEFDALLARQHGLPAVTSTAGTSWSPSWDRYLPRRRVAVLYDAGAHSYQLACHRATGLAKAGATDAWAVDLRQAGLDGGEDLTDWFVTYRFSAKKLVRLIRSARQEAN